MIFPHDELASSLVTLARGRYEQLLALPPPSRGGKAPGIGGNGGKLHSCLICGKLFVTGEFLQQHIARKHTRKDEGEGTDER